MKRLTATLTTICLLATFTARTSAVEGYQPNQGIDILKRLETSVSELVKRYYPEATSNSFQDVIHFEHATRLYVTEAIVKIPAGQKAPQVVARGPLKGGVWCDIRFQNQTLPPYQRSEGAINRDDFVEHVFYSHDQENRCHLVVTLRTPLEPTDREREFINALQKHLKGFGAFIDRQTSLPNTSNLPDLPGGLDLHVRPQKKR